MNWDDPLYPVIKRAILDYCITGADLDVVSVDCAAACRKLIAAEREARKDEGRDAARYRWLRKQDWFSGPLAVLRDPKRVLTSGSGLGADCPSGDRLDDAIDTALAPDGDAMSEGSATTGGTAERAA